MPRVIFDSDHDLFRETDRRFIDNEIVPYVPKWEHAGKIDTKMFRSAGQAGPRVQTIYVGTNGIMTGIVGRSLEI